MGIDVNIKDYQGLTPLMYMVEEGLKSQIKKEKDLFYWKTCELFKI